jgi:sortase B
MKKIILALLVLSMAFSLYSIIHYRVEMSQSQNVVNKLQSLEKEIKQEPSVIKKLTKTPEIKVNEGFDNHFDLKANPNKILLDEIKDYVGWIEVEDSKINYPVVKTSDNEFYLNHDYNQNDNIAGAIFMDRRNLGNSFDNHTIIYGHRMKNGSMFTDLDLFLDSDYLSTNPSIIYKDLFTTYEFEVLASFIVSADDYILPYEINETVLKDFFLRSNYTSKYEYDPNHRFITLSTCNYDVENGRVIVFGVYKP